MSVRKNFVYNVAYQVLALAIPLITAPYLSRVLGSDGLGTYSYTYSVAQYFVLFAMLGVNNYGNRSIAVARDDPHELRKVFWGIWFLQFALSLVFLGLYVFYSIKFAGSTLLALIWIPYVLTAGLDVNWLFFGLEKFKVTVTRNFIVKLTTFTLTFVVVRGDSALVNYLVLMSVSLFVSVAVLWPFVVKEVGFSVPSWREVVCHIKPSLVLFVPVVAVSLYTVLDKVMLGQMAGMSETGIFENSLKVAQMPFALIAALGTVMLPHASNLLARGMSREATEYMGPSMWFALLLSFAFTLGLIAVTPEFVPVFFGVGFEACCVVMPIIVLEMPFMAWANVIRTQWLIPRGEDRAYVVSVIAGAITNVVVNLLLIPHFGALGAAFGTLAAEIAVCVVQTLVVARQLPLSKWITEAIPGFVIGIAMMIFVRVLASALPGGVACLVLEILFGAMFFTLAAAVWFATTKNEYSRKLLCPIFERLCRKRLF